MEDVTPSEFWNDLETELRDPRSLRQFITESIRISTIDDVVNSLDHARQEAGMSKAELARAIGAEPAVVRRLLSSSAPNPTLGTLAEVAAALGLQVRLVPMHAADRRAITDALLLGAAQTGTTELRAA